MKYLLTVRSSSMIQIFTLISLKLMSNWKFLFTPKQVLKHKEVVSILHVGYNGLWKIWTLYTFHLSTRILTSTHTKVFNFFFVFYMSRWQTMNFRLSIMSKLNAKHISTKVPLKITNRKTHVYIDKRWPWIWNQYFYLGIWNDDRTKIIVLPSFQLGTRLRSQNRNETELINELWHINLCMNIGISNWHYWNFDLT